MRGNAFDACACNAARIRPGAAPVNRQTRRAGQAARALRLGLCVATAGCDATMTTSGAGDPGRTGGAETGPSASADTAARSPDGLAASPDDAGRGPGPDPRDAERPADASGPDQPDGVSRPDAAGSGGTIETPPPPPGADAAPPPPEPPPLPDAAPPPPEPPPEAPCVDRPYAVPANCPFEGRVDVVVWTVGGWNLLADAFAAHPSPCVHYYLSVPPFTADKTTLRPGEAARIRAHGPQFHALAEFSDTAWGEWRAANDTTWIAAGQEFRRRAAEAGYCFGQGDGFMVNEVHSSIRSDPASRDRWVNLFRALHEGADGAADDAPGGAAVVGMAHAGQNLGVYKANLQGWLADADFWEGVAPNVRWWLQESYCDTRNVCVAGDLDARATHINRYAMHVGRQSVVAPDGAGVNTAQSYFSRAFAPMLNAVWGSTPENGYGNTDVTLTQMQMFVTEQIYAHRRYASANAHPAGRLSFALQSYRTPREYAAIGERMAQAIAAAYAPGGEAVDACAGNGGAQGWCRCAVDGAAFNPAWVDFQVW